MKKVRVGLVGANFMGRAHSNAYRQIPFYWPELPAQPEMKVLCERIQERGIACGKQFGWGEVVFDYKDLLKRDDIDLIDIATPNNQHAEMIIEAAQAGKHVFCEKPLATNLADAKAALKAVQKAGVMHMINFNYRRAPAVSLAKRMIDAGLLGQIYHWRATYLQDWLLDPAAPMMWRVQKAIAGSGALGDLMAHSFDLALWLVGGIDSLVCDTRTFVKKRPKLESFNTGLGGKAKAGAPMGTVDVDDGSLALVRFSNGAMGSFEATRFGAGHKNSNIFEINGSKGSLRFDQQRMNELEYYSVEDGDLAGFRTILATEDTHPFLGLPGGGPRYWPAGHILGYEHTFINGVADLMTTIAKKKLPSPNFADGVKVQALLAACEESADGGKWVKVPKV
jgi:predicted dehydrogenase